MAAAPVRTQVAIGPLELRRAFGTFVTGITIVTTTDEAGLPRGMTANSFTSVSLDPPLLLVCIGKSAASFDAFSHCPSFAINLLHEAQKELSVLFASKSPDKFQALRHDRMHTAATSTSGATPALASTWIRVMATASRSSTAARALGGRSPPDGWLTNKAGEIRMRTAIYRRASGVCDPLRAQHRYRRRLDQHRSRRCLHVANARSKESSHGRCGGFDVMRELSRAKGVVKDVVIDHSGAVQDPFVIKSR